MGKNSWNLDNHASGRSYMKGDSPYIKYDDKIKLISQIMEGLKEFILAEAAVRITLDTPKGNAERAILSMPFETDQDLFLLNFATLIYQSLIGFYVSADPKTSHFGISNEVFEGNMNSLVKREMEKLIDKFKERDDIAGRLLKNIKVVSDEVSLSATNDFLSDTLKNGLDIHAGYRIVAKGNAVNCTQLFLPIDTGTEIINRIYKNIEQMLLHDFVTYDESGDHYLTLTDTLIYRDLESILQRSKSKENTRKKLLNNLKFNTVISKNQEIDHDAPPFDLLYDLLNHVQDTKYREAVEHSNVLYSTNVLEVAGKFRPGMPLYRDQQNALRKEAEDLLSPDSKSQEIRVSQIGKSPQTLLSEAGLLDAQKKIEDGMSDGDINTLQSNASALENQRQDSVSKNTISEADATGDTTPVYNDLDDITATAKQNEVSTLTEKIQENKGEITQKVELIVEKESEESETLDVDPVNSSDDSEKQDSDLSTPEEIAQTDIPVSVSGVDKGEVGEKTTPASETPSFEENQSAEDDFSRSTLTKDIDFRKKDEGEPSLITVQATEAAKENDTNDVRIPADDMSSSDTVLTELTEVESTHIAKASAGKENEEPEASTRMEGEESEASAEMESEESEASAEKESEESEASAEKESEESEASAGMESEGSEASAGMESEESEASAGMESEESEASAGMEGEGSEASAGMEGEGSEPSTEKESEELEMSDVDTASSSIGSIKQESDLSIPKEIAQTDSSASESGVDKGEAIEKTVSTDEKAPLGENQAIGDDSSKTVINREETVEDVSPEENPLVESGSPESVLDHNKDLLRGEGDKPSVPTAETSEGTSNESAKEMGESGSSPHDENFEHVDSIEDKPNQTTEFVIRDSGAKTDPSRVDESITSNEGEIVMGAVAEDVKPAQTDTLNPDEGETVTGAVAEDVKPAQTDTLNPDEGETVTGAVAEDVKPAQTDTSNPDEGDTVIGEVSDSLKLTQTDLSDSDVIAETNKIEEESSTVQSNNEVDKDSVGVEKKGTDVVSQIETTTPVSDKNGLEKLDSTSEVGVSAEDDVQMSDFDSSRISAQRETSALASDEGKETTANTRSSDHDTTTRENAPIMDSVPVHTEKEEDLSTITSQSIKDSETSVAAFTMSIDQTTEERVSRLKQPTESLEVPVAKSELRASSSNLNPNDGTVDKRKETTGVLNHQKTEIPPQKSSKKMGNKGFLSPDRKRSKPKNKPQPDKINSTKDKQGAHPAEKSDVERSILSISQSVLERANRQTTAERGMKTRAIRKKKRRTLVKKKTVIPQKTESFRMTAPNKQKLTTLTKEKRLNILKDPPLDNLSELNKMKAIESLNEKDIPKKNDFSDKRILKNEKGNQKDISTSTDTPHTKASEDLSPHSSLKRALTFPDKTAQGQDIDDSEYIDNRRKQKISRSSQRRTRKSYVPHPLKVTGFSSTSRRYYEKGPQKIRIASMSSNTPKRKKM